MCSWRQSVQVVILLDVACSGNMSNRSMAVGIFFGWGFEILARSYLRLTLLSQIDVP